MEVRLKDIASEKGKSLNQIARDTGIRRRDLSNYANGHVVPSVVRGIKIARALDVCPHEIWIFSADK